MREYLTYGWLNFILNHYYLEWDEIALDEIPIKSRLKIYTEALIGALITLFGYKYLNLNIYGKELLMSIILISGSYFIGAIAGMLCEILQEALYKTLKSIKFKELDGFEMLEEGTYIFQGILIGPMLVGILLILKSLATYSTSP